jgi:hypothetical protein
MLNPKGSLHGVTTLPFADTQRTCAHSAYGRPVIHGSWCAIESAGIFRPW